MSKFIEETKGFLELSGWDYQAFMHWFWEMRKLIFIIAVIVGILLCFFGGKLHRVFGGLSGFVLGSGLHLGVLFLLGSSWETKVGKIVILPFLFLVLGAWSKRLGGSMLILFWGGISSVLVLGGLEQKRWIFFWVFFGLIILLAVATLFLPDTFLMVGTAFLGGCFIAGAMYYLLLEIGIFPEDGRVLLGKWILAGVLVFLGVWIQMLLQSRSIGKKEKKLSQQIKQEESRETEIEQARKLLEEEEL